MRQFGAHESCPPPPKTQADACMQVVLFCVGAQSAIIAVLNLALGAAWPRAAQHTVLVPWRGGRRMAVPTSVLVFAPISVGLAVLWGTHRGASWAWTYQARSRAADMHVVNDHVLPCRPCYWACKSVPSRMVEPSLKTMAVASCRMSWGSASCCHACVASGSTA